MTRHRRQIIGLDAGKHASQVSWRAMQMGIDGDNPVDYPASSAPTTLLADGFARVKGCVLPHVAEIGREQDKPLGASAPQRFGREQQRDKFLVRLVERRIDDGRGRGRTGRHPNLAVGKAMHRQSRATGTPSREASRRGILATDDGRH